MPLSDHEQAMLQQMEQALAAEDPKFASQMQGSTTPSIGRRGWLIAIACVVGGLSLILLGVNYAWWLGIIGFLLMVAGVAFAFTPRRADDPSGSRPGASGSGSTSRSRRSNSSGSKRNLINRLEARWDRREDGRW